MNRPKPKVAAIVVTYNRLEDLKKCLKSIQAQEGVALDIIVVNNHSTDGTREYLEKQTIVHSLHLEQNLGGAGGFKAGLEYALQLESDFFWIMDDDVLPTSDALKSLLHFHSNHDVDGFLVSLA